MQESEKGILHLTACHTKTCNEAQSIYFITEMEALAVVWTLKYVKEYINSSRVIVYTDHRALLWVFKDSNNLSGKFARWFLTIQDSDP